ncbi:hypothetical protein J7E62_09150 [Variovorax paradoxus]|nr:hypothetical protein [Variovorax paradoxus]
MGLLDALADEDFRRGTGRGLRDAANRGIVGGLLGAPVDLTAGVVNAGLMGGGVLGHELGLLGADQMPQPITAPVGGSEWLGQKMQDAGMVSPERQPLAEFLASMAGPGAAVKGARGMSMAADALPALMPSRGSLPSLVGQFGAIDPKGKARLLSDLQGGTSSGRYRLGDVTEGQGKGLDALFGREAASRDVYMTDDAYRHLVERRLIDQGFSPEDVALFTEQAMAKRARPNLDPSKGGQFPALLNSGVSDPVSGRTFDARMPLKSTDDGYEVRSVVPEGLRGRNNKAPKR